MLSSLPCGVFGNCLTSGSDRLLGSGNSGTPGRARPYSQGLFSSSLLSEAIAEGSVSRNRAGCGSLRLWDEPSRSDQLFEPAACREKRVAQTIAYPCRILRRISFALVLAVRQARRLPRWSKCPLVGLRKQRAGRQGVCPRIHKVKQESFSSSPNAEATAEGTSRRVGRLCLLRFAVLVG